MATEKKLYEGRIIQDPNILVGKPVVKGTRIPVSLILNLLAHGHDNAEICDDYPNLTEQDITAAIAYAADHIDREASNTASRAM